MILKEQLTAAQALHDEGHHHGNDMKISEAIRILDADEGDSVHLDSARPDHWLAFWREEMSPMQSAVMRRPTGPVL